MHKSQSCSVIIDSMGHLQQPIICINHHIIYAIFPSQILATLNKSIEISKTKVITFLQINLGIKDDFVPECLLEFQPLRQDLEKIYKDGCYEVFTFYMFKYKSSWCPNKKDSHDSKSCIYAHHMRDFRRPPDLFKYLPEDCETLIKGVG